MKKNREKKYINKIFTLLVIGIFLFIFSLNNKISAIDLSGTITGEIIDDINGDGIKLDWENPNKDGDNPYRFKSENIIDAGLIMKVIGCTGVVDRVSSELSSVFKIKNAASGVSNLLKTGDNEIENAADEMIKLEVPTKSEDVVKATDEVTEEERKANLREQCLNGIAYTLAKNQLTDMTRYTLNWITSGFSGDPFYVRNMERFMTSLNDGIIKKEIEMFGNIPAYPYSTSFSRSYISTYKQRIKNFEDTMMSSMLHYLEEGKEVEDFADNFLVGGWDGFIAMTQFPQNNPLGYTMVMSQNIADKQTEKAEEIKQELNSSTPTLSQKTCVKWELTKDAKDLEGAIEEKEKEVEEANKKYNDALRDLENFYTENNIDKNITNYEDIKEEFGEEKADEFYSHKNYINLFNGQYESIFKTYNNLLSSRQENNVECVEWEVVTPGKFITDKVTQTLNSPERQLELADTLNEALNMLFTNLIAKLQNQGLTSLKSDPTLFSDLNLVGEGSNSGINLYSKSTGYGDDFDVIKNLGNTYYKEKEIVGRAGYWNAKNNTTSETKNGEYNLPGLYKGFGPKNQYYEVTEGGASVVLFEGNRGWKEGDRAFFDGKNWQRWDCKTTTEIINGENIEKCSEQGQKLPIKEKGVIQKQEEFIVVAREVMASYIPIMPKLGELDYCIPGPNPNWASNSSEARQAYINYIEGYHTKDIAGIADKAFQVWVSIRSFLTLGLETTILDALGFGGVGDGTNLIIVPPEINSPKYDFYERVFTESNSKQIWDHLTTGENMLMPIFGKPTFLDMVSPDDQIITALENKITNIKYLVRNLIGEYEQEVNKKYFDNITKKYILFEDKDVDNPEYLAMAKEGLALTRNMVSYDNGIKEANEYYEDSISDVTTAMSQLKIWRSEINGIIKAAQDRRREKMKKELGLEDEELDKKIAELTEAGCFEDEELIFIDEYELTTTITERCDDGVDNDLDGLIDQDDPDCAGYYQTNTTPTIPVREIPNRRGDNIERETEREFLLY